MNSHMKKVVVAMAFAVGVASSLVAETLPGLLQFYWVAPANDKTNVTRYNYEYWNDVNVKGYKGAENGSGPVRTLGAIAGDGNNSFKNSITGETYSWDDWGCYIYEGEIYLEAGKTYTFCVSFDDAASVLIGGNVITEHPIGTSGYNQPGWIGSFKPLVTAWYPIIGYIWDWTGGKAKGSVLSGIQWTDSENEDDINNTGKRKDSSLWHPLMDDGSGTFLRCNEEGLNGNGTLTVAVEKPAVASHITLAVGSYTLSAGRPCQSMNCVAEASFTENDVLYMLEGFVLQTSADGETWSEPITNLNESTYSYCANKNFDEKVTWIYREISEFLDTVYVDPINGSDSNDGAEDRPIKTLEYASLVVPAENGTIHLLPGVHYVDVTIPLSNFSNLRILGADASTTFVEPVANMKRQLFSIADSDGISFEGITFRKADAETIGAIAGQGGAFYISNSTKIDFKNCDFKENRIHSTNGNAYGGAVFANNAVVSMTDCVLEENVAWASNQGFGGAICATASGANQGGFFCTNVVFSGNKVCAQGGSVQTAYGIAGYFYGGTTNEIVEALFVRQDGMIGYSKTKEYDSGFGAGVCGISDSQTRLLVKKSTVANNIVDSAFYGGGGKITVEDSIVTGCRALSSNGWNLELRNCFYDFSQNSRKSALTNCVQGDVQFLPDYSVPLTSPAYGYGRTSAPMEFTPQTWYVNPTALANGDGRSPATAFDSVTAALTVARDCDTIELAAGHYTCAKETFPLVVNNLKWFTLRGAGSDQTIFEPGGGENDVAMVLKIKDCFSSTFEGFRIQGFESSGAKDIIENDISQTAMGVFADGGSRLLLRDIVVKNCHRLATGTPKTIQGTHFKIGRVASVRVDRCKVNDNGTIANGNWNVSGVAYFARAFGVVSSCEFKSNETSSQNGNAYVGIILYGGNNRSDAPYTSWEIRNSLIANNTTNHLAGFETKNLKNDTVHFSTSFQDIPRMFNCTVVGSANIPLTGPSNYFFVQNCIIANCGKVYGSKVQFYNTIVVTNAAFEGSAMENQTSSYSYVNGVNYGAPSNLIFVADAKFKNLERGNYQLLRDSPAVNVGCSQYWIDGTFDPDGTDWLGSDSCDLVGNVRLVGAAVDAGCYEVQKATGFSIIVR